MKIDQEVVDRLIEELARERTPNLYLFSVVAATTVANNLDRIATVLERLAPASPANDDKGPEAEAPEPETPYSQPFCGFNYCPHPDTCRATLSGCVQIVTG